MLKKPELAAKLLGKYKQPFLDVPFNHFSEFGLKELMIKGYFNCKSGSAGGFMTKVKEVKTKVQAASRKMADAGTPLYKFPAERDLLTLSGNSSLIDTMTKWDR